MKLKYFAYICRKIILAIIKTMNIMKKIIYFLTIALFLTTAVVSCKKVKVTDIQLNKIELTLREGKTESLIATVLPEDADDKTVSWVSSNPTVTMVDHNGKVTAKTIGNATITVTNKESGKSANCKVTVLHSEEWEQDQIMDSIAKKLWGKWQDSYHQNETYVFCEDTIYWTITSPTFGDVTQLMTYQLIAEDSMEVNRPWGYYPEFIVSRNKFYFLSDTVLYLESFGLSAIPEQPFFNVKLLKIE